MTCMTALSSSGDSTPPALQSQPLLYVIDYITGWSWLRGVDLNHRPLGYEPNELPDCSTPQKNHNSGVGKGQTVAAQTTFAGTAGGVSQCGLDVRRRGRAIQASIF